MTPEDYGIPDYMAPELLRYVKHGVLPGAFLNAVLENNLRWAVASADSTSARLLPAYVKFLHNEALPQCWGSPENVKEWVRMHNQKRET